MRDKRERGERDGGQKNLKTNSREGKDKRMRERASHSLPSPEQMWQQQKRER